MRMMTKREAEARLMVKPDMATRLTARPPFTRPLPEPTTPPTSAQSTRFLLYQLYTRFLLYQLFSTEDTVCILHPECLWDTPTPPWATQSCPSSRQLTQRPLKTLHR